MSIKKIGKAWVKEKQRPILLAREIQRGKNRGKVQVVLTKGRDAQGNVRPGRKYIIPADGVIVWPEKEE